MKSQGTRKRIVVVCPYDESTVYAISRALREGLADFTLVGRSDEILRLCPVQGNEEHISIVEAKDMDEAADKAVELIRKGRGDALMKGLINTDKLLHAVLNKERGILPRGRVLTHVALVKVPSYEKLLFVSDAAVIPFPTLEQRAEMVRYVALLAGKFGIQRPKISLIHCSEKTSEKFPVTLQYQEIKAMAQRGEFSGAVVDGPLDVKTSCDRHSNEVKGIASLINGEADALIFPDIESGNVFYKTVSLFSKAQMAGTLQGTLCPVVLSSRSDTGESKYCSIAFACLASE